MAFSPPNDVRSSFLAINNRVHVFFMRTLMMWNTKHEDNYLLCKYITEIKLKKFLDPFLNCPYKV